MIRCPYCDEPIEVPHPPCPHCGYEFIDDNEPNPLAWREELDEDDPLRTGESEWERGLRTGDST